MSYDYESTLQLSLNVENRSSFKVGASLNEMPMMEFPGKLKFMFFLDQSFYNFFQGNMEPTDMMTKKYRRFILFDFQNYFCRKRIVQWTCRWTSDSPETVAKNLKLSKADDDN